MRIRLFGNNSNHNYVETENLAVEYGRDGDDIVVYIRAKGVYKKGCKYRRLVVKAWLEPSEDVDMDVDIKTAPAQA